VLQGVEDVKTRMSHYRLCNGKRRNKNAVCGPMQIRFHRGNGVSEIKGQENAFFFWFAMILSFYLCAILKASF
ncbi:hypothetical protein AML49_08870, partial [Escherichia coli]